MLLSIWVKFSVLHTCWFVEAQVKFIYVAQVVFKGENSADMIL